MSDEMYSIKRCLIAITEFPLKHKNVYEEEEADVHLLQPTKFTT